MMNANAKQTIAIKLAEKGHNLLITGQAGQEKRN